MLVAKRAAASALVGSCWSKYQNAIRLGPWKERGESCSMLRVREGSSRQTGTRRAVRTPPRTTRAATDRKSTRLNSSHGYISYAVFCLKKKKIEILDNEEQRRHDATQDCLDGIRNTCIQQEVRPIKLL